jgi:hypothetical protein
MKRGQTWWKIRLIQMGSRPTPIKDPSTGKSIPQYQIHPADVPEYPKPHIKWSDWSSGKSTGADGHIFFGGN